MKSDTDLNLEVEKFFEVMKTKTPDINFVVMYVTVADLISDKIRQLVKERFQTYDIPDLIRVADLIQKKGIDAQKIGNEAPKPPIAETRKTMEPQKKPKAHNPRMN